MTDAQPTDVEIYVKALTALEAETWLKESLSDLTPMKKKKGMPKNTFSYEGQWKDSHFTIIVFENVAPGFTSIWFDSTALPWPSDESCAKHAAETLNKNVRITAGGWQQQDDPDAWFEVRPNGETTELKWKT